MTDVGDVKSQLLTKIYQSTQENKDGSGKADNLPFRMSFNRHNKAGPPTVMRIGFTETVLAEFEPESKLRQSLKRFLDTAIYPAFYSTASIDGGMLIPMVTEKVIYDQRLPEEKKGGMLDGIFGDKNKKKDAGGGMGF